MSYPVCVRLCVFVWARARVCVCQIMLRSFYYLTSLITPLRASRVYYYSIIDMTINAIVSLFSKHSFVHSS